MASVSISISASKAEDADNAQETDELAIAQELAQQLKDDGYSVTGSFYGIGGSTPLTGVETAATPEDAGTATADTSDTSAT